MNLGPHKTFQLGPTAPKAGPASWLSKKVQEIAVAVPRNVEKKKGRQQSIDSFTSRVDWTSARFDGLLDPPGYY